MKKILFCLLFLSYSAFCQEHPVELLNTKNDKGFLISATNYSTTQHEVTVTLVVKNLMGYKKPITLLVPAQSTKEVVQLHFIKGKVSKYSSKYKYISKPTSIESAFIQKHLEERALGGDSDISKGIVVFSKDGCTRCHYVTSYMLDNNIKFKFLNTTTNLEYKKLMWAIIRRNNPAYVANNISMPVVLIDGKVSYNMDLKNFVSGLKN